MTSSYDVLTQLGEPQVEIELVFYFTGPFNNMRTLKFKAQPTNAFLATVNQIFGSSSQLPTTAERAVIKSLCTGSDNETVLRSSRKLGGPAEHLIDGSEKRICRSNCEL